MRASMTYGYQRAPTVRDQRRMRLPLCASCVSMLVGLGWPAQEISFVGPGRMNPAHGMATNGLLQPPPGH
jgi:hypothetical protein